MRMGIAWCEGWDPAVAEATVPDSMIGKTGRIHAGVTVSSQSQFHFFEIEETSRDKVDEQCRRTRL